MPTIKTPEQLYDVRLIKRHLEQNKIKQKDLEKFLKDLEDVGENIDFITEELVLETDVEKEDDSATDEEPDLG